ncbi:MAG: hypothetical protein KME10_18465 [Plectolyngbya sp. WJT66-NPBG17]|jgi:hypothetical protein|nr:hypothetical protein [Plectolyngbya sp. WJT66-NPBG17]MBW4527582.1 hypothetical protein [Phormidium tanganyikae FI6-MK23]
MPSSTSRYRDWVDKRNDPLDRKQIAYAALDAYEEIANRDLIQLDDLTPIITAAKSQYMTVWDVGTVFLVRLAETHIAAQGAMLEIMDSPKAKERLHLIWALTARLPEDFRMNIIRKAISDRAKRVRTIAAAKADLFGFKELLLELEAQRDRESDDDVRNTLQFHIVMLRSGYILERDADGNPCLSVRTKNGWTSPRITQEDIDQGRLGSKIEEMQTKDY